MRFVEFFILLLLSFFRTIFCTHFSPCTGFCPGRAIEPFALKNGEGAKNPNRWAPERANFF